jgi:oxygen-independent coproporphyrinogen-3 oxidase
MAHSEGTLSAQQQSDRFAIYLHIPFCRTLCPYCDFVKERTRGTVPDGFVDAVCAEIEAFEGPQEAGSIFFGGGTPSLLRPDSLDRVMKALHRRFKLVEPEVTLEANPDDLSEDLIQHWRAAGINRVSLGVQSFHDKTLRYLGRRHNAASAIRGCELVASQFERWSLDLIFGAPPVEAWPETLRQCLALDPPHVAAYGLTYELGTPFERRAKEAIDDETALSMYRQAEEALAEYDHYEISNWAKSGQHSTHNLVYWHNREYAGFGTGAYSFVDGVRARNHIETETYLQAPGEKMEAIRLDDREIRVETVIQYLRLREGLPKAAYAARFNAEVGEDFGPEIKALIDRGLLVEEDNHLRPTAEGFYLNNEIGLALVS